MALSLAMLLNPKIKNLMYTLYVLYCTWTVEKNSRSKDAHDQETQQQENLTTRTTSGAIHRNRKDRNVPITVVENQPITAEHHAL